MTFSPAAGRAVVFARQPGTFAVVFDPSGREAPVTIPSIEGRHFFGHGVFSPDGKLLYATENDFDAARGHDRRLRRLVAATRASASSRPTASARTKSC